MRTIESERKHRSTEDEAAHDSVGVHSFQLQLLLYSQIHSDEQVVLEAATELGVSVINTEDCQDAKKSLSTWKFDGIVIDAELDGAEEVLKSASSSPSNAPVPVMCLLPHAGNAPAAVRTRAAMTATRPFSPETMTTSMQSFWAKMLAERQRYYRWPVDIEVTCTLPGGETRKYRAQNISRGGIAIAGSLGNYPVVILQFTLPEIGREITTTGKIVWGDSTRSAVRFHELAAADLLDLVELLNRKCKQALGIDDVQIRSITGG